MPDRDSEFTEAVLEIVNEWHQERKRAAEPTVLPFMMEKLTRPEIRTRARRLRGEQLKRFIGQVGVDKMLQIMRKEYSNAP